MYTPVLEEVTCNVNSRSPSEANSSDIPNVSKAGNEAISSTAGPFNDRPIGTTVCH